MSAGRARVEALVTGGVSGVKRIVVLLQIMQRSHLIYYSDGGEAFLLGPPPTETTSTLSWLNLRDLFHSNFLVSTQKLSFFTQKLTCKTAAWCFRDDEGNMITLWNLLTTDFVRLNHDEIKLLYSKKSWAVISLCADWKRTQTCSSSSGVLVWN